jgi:hypothetical protein
MWVSASIFMTQVYASRGRAAAGNALRGGTIYGYSGGAGTSIANFAIEPERAKSILRQFVDLCFTGEFRLGNRSEAAFGAMIREFAPYGVE